MLYVSLMVAGLIAVGPEAPQGSPEMGVLKYNCAAGKALECQWIGDVHRAGGDVDQIFAAHYYKQACDRNAIQSCHALAVFHFRGLGAAKDATRAAALLKHACELGLAESCTTLGFLFEKTTYAPRDWSGLKAHWDQACQKGEAPACQNLGLMFRDEGVYFEAEKLFQKACQGGVQASCLLVPEAMFAQSRFERMKSEVMGRRPQPGGEEVCARHILIAVPAGGGEAAARQRAQTILRSLQAGKDFAELARKFSEDASNAKGGGDIGCFARGAMVKEFEDVAFALKVGETSAVVKTPFGFHVIQRVAKGVAR